MTLPQPFAASHREVTGGGVDLPGSTGDRERGRFRPSLTPRLTAVAVVGDDGESITQGTDELLRELLLWQKATVLALVLTEERETFTMESLLADALKLE